MWYRVFSSTSIEPSPANVVKHIEANGYAVRHRFISDADGWFEAVIETDDEMLEIDRYLAMEEGIRAELNTWAAWLETKEHQPEAACLMQQIIAASQVYTIEGPEEFETAGLCEVICRYLAHSTDGVYQIDGQGLFSAEGILLVAE